MKKIILILVIIFTIIIFICFFNRSSGIMICTYRNSADIYSIDTMYKVSYNNKIVNKVYTKEEIISSDEDLLKDYKFTLDSIYSKYRNFDNYSNKVILEKNKIISITNINYQKLDVDEFIKIDKNNKNLFDNKKIKINNLKKLYKANGAKCIYK